MIDFTAFSSALTKVIQPAIKSQIYRRAPMWQLIGGWSAEQRVATRANVGVDRFENNQFYIPIMDMNHSGVVSIAPGESYQYGQPGLNTTVAALRTIVGSFTIQKQQLNTTNAGAIVKPLIYYSKTLAWHMALDANRQVYGASTGAIGTANATQSPASASFVFAPSTNSYIDYSRYVPVGTWIKIGSNVPQQVAAVTGDNAITLTNAITWSQGDSVYKTTGSGTNATCLDGLSAMVAATGTYQGLSTASDNSWKSSANTSPGTLGTVTIQGAMNTQYFAANKTGACHWIVTNVPGFLTYGQSLVGQVRFSPKDMLWGGWTGLAYMGGNANILLDYDCPDDRMYFLSEEDLDFMQLQDFEFEKGTDGTLLKIAQQLNYEVTASWMGNIGTDLRSGHGVIANATFVQTAV